MTSNDEKNGSIDSKNLPTDKSDNTSTATEPTSEPTVEKPLEEMDEAERNYQPKSTKFWLIMLSTFISVFIVALDRTILSTAIPQITNDFHSLGDIGWYGSSYMLTTAAFQLLFGRIYRFYDLRSTFLWCIVVFEIGSAICGAAPSSIAFIIGRAIAGMGSAGIMTGAMMVVIPMVPLHKRPVFQSIFALIFGVSSATGPIIGGAFTEKATWRWCFYMNLPIGVTAFACLFFFMKTAETKREPVTLKQHIMRLDPLGTLFFIPSMVCLVLALQWGGSTYDWSDWHMIVLWVFFGVTAIAFIAVQIAMPDSASFPIKVITQRTMWAGTSYMILLSGAMFLVIYYIPLWFQTTHNVKPVDSGVYTLPLVVSISIAAMISGIATQKIGYYKPSMLICPCIMAIGQGLMTTFKPSTGSGQWIGYQFLVGFGLGFGMQTVGLAIQATLPKEDVPTGLSISFWAQQVGGAISISVGQTLLSTTLVSRLANMEGIDPKMILNTGATDLHKILSSEKFSIVANAYNFACTRIFLVAAALSVAQLLFGICVPWRSIKKGKQGPPTPVSE